VVETISSPAVGEGLDGEGLGGLAGGGGEAGDSAFECGDALLEYVGGGIHERV
jgi:hypothetical protein